MASRPAQAATALLLLLHQVRATDTPLQPQAIHVRLLRQHHYPLQEDDPGGGTRRRRLNGDEEVRACHKSGSFLGVGNVDCLHSNLGTAIFLLAVIIIVSLLVERVIQAVRRVIACPQLKKIVNRIFEEVMIMGFISMVIFTLNTSGLMEKIHSAFDGDLSGSERLHFYEFFHYIVFLTMIYFILIVLFLLFVGTVVPKLIWNNQSPDDWDSELEEVENSTMLEDDSGGLVGQRWSRQTRCRDDTLLESTSGLSDDHLSRREHPSAASGRQLYRASALRARAESGMDLVQGSRAYALLLQRYQREGWCFMFNIKKQWNLWKSFEILAYNICQNRSGYIYKNPEEMKRLFGVARKFHGDGSPKPMTYEQFHVLCMRNLLFNISHLHFSAFFVLLLIAVVPVLYPEYDHWIFLGVGGMLLLVNLVIFLKVLQILRGIVDDRLRIITTSDIRRRMPRPSLNPNREEGKRKPPSLRVVALSVRAVIRMQMSSLCHHQLHYHNDRFWFNSPRFLLRLFHFATIGQAFYLVWFTLVEWQTVASTSSAYYLIPIMVLLPFIAMCVITPMTMPSLVLVMSLTGIFVELNGNDPTSGQRPTQRETKTHIRLLRRSYLKSHYTDTEDPASPIVPQESVSRPLDGVASPSSVFLRMYDSPSAAAQHAKFVESSSPRRTNVYRDQGSLLSKRSATATSLSWGASEELRDQSRNRRSFDLSAFQSYVASNAYQDAHRKASLDLDHQRFATRPLEQNKDSSTDAPRTSTPPISPAFKNYCSKYGGYPDA